MLIGGVGRRVTGGCSVDETDCTGVAASTVGCCSVCRGVVGKAEVGEGGGA